MGHPSGTPYSAPDPPHAREAFGREAVVHGSGLSGPSSTARCLVSARLGEERPRPSCSWLGLPDTAPSPDRSTRNFSRLGRLTSNDGAEGPPRRDKSRGHLAVYPSVGRPLSGRVMGPSLDKKYLIIAVERSIPSGTRTR